MRQRALGSVQLLPRRHSTEAGGQKGAPQVTHIGWSDCFSSWERVSGDNVIATGHILHMSVGSHFSHIPTYFSSPVLDSDALPCLRAPLRLCQSPELSLQHPFHLSGNKSTYTDDTPTWAANGLHLPVGLQVHGVLRLGSASIKLQPVIHSQQFPCPKH